MHQKVHYYVCLILILYTDIDLATAENLDKFY